MRVDPQGDPSATAWSIVITGDSLDRSALVTPATSGWAWLVAASLAANVVANNAADGASIAGITSNFSTISAYGWKYGPSPILLVDGAVNNLLAGQSGAAAYAELETFVAGARSAGYACIAWLTPIAVTTYSAPAGYETQRQAFNTLLRTRGDVDLVLDTDLMGPITRVDGLHPDEPGHLTIATYSTPFVRAAAARLVPLP
jgi:hypothetical protein